MKVVVKCSQCGKVLGEYVGEEFYIFSMITAKEHPPRILCEKCYKKKTSR